MIAAVLKTISKIVEKWKSPDLFSLIQQLVLKQRPSQAAYSDDDILHRGKHHQYRL
jgi:hypothetical protein